MAAYVNKLGEANSDSQSRIPTPAEKPESNPQIRNPYQIQRQGSGSLNQDQPKSDNNLPKPQLSAVPIKPIQKPEGQTLQIQQKQAITPKTFGVMYVLFVFEEK